MLLPLIVVGGIALLALAQTARKVSAHTEPEQPPSHPAPAPTPQPDPLPSDPVKQPPSQPSTPAPSELPAVPPIPNPGRPDRIARLFVLDTTDKPLPAGGLEAIRHRYKMAADWVRIEAGKGIAYHPDITHLTLPYTSAEIRQIVLSSAAAGEKGQLNNKSGSTLLGTPRRPAPEFAEDIYPGGLPALIFDSLESYAREVNEPLNNPRNPDLIPLNQTWMFIVRGAGGYGGGLWWFPGKRESIGWGILGDATLWAWLSDAGLEENLAHEVIFVDDTQGRHEWEAGWDKNDIAYTLESRKGYGTANAQTGSFIHESFHGLFAAIHVGEEDIAKIRAENPNDPRIALWAADPVNNIMGGSHLDWDGSHGKDGAKAKIHAITYSEMDEGNFWL